MISLGYYEIILAILCFLLFSLLSKKDGTPTNWPVVGMLPSLISHLHQIHEHTTNLLERTGGTFLVKGPLLANMDMLVTADPANVHHIMSANFSNYPKGPEFAKIFDFLGEGIFNSDADSWKTQRKVARILITHNRFHQFLVTNTQEKVAKGLIPVLDHFSRSENAVDMQDLFQRLTFDSTCMLVTGYDPGCLSMELPDVPFSKAMDEVEEIVLYRHIIPKSIWRLQRWLGIWQEKKMGEACKTLNNVIGKYVTMKREELRKGLQPKEEDGIDLLTSYLLEDEITGAFELSDVFLKDTILNFMIAGRDTTSSGLTWFMWLLSTHPNVNEKIREELKAIIPTNDSPGWRLFGVQEVSKLVYLHAAICESLRLYPPVPFEHKEPLHEDTLPSGNYVYPKMKILLPLYAMGRMKFIWGEDSLEFKPERWISEKGTIKHEPSYKFLSFNAGPRTCLGKEVAFTQMKTVAAAIIHNYNIKMVKGHLVEPNASIILYMVYGFKVKVTKRW